MAIRRIDKSKSPCETGLGRGIRYVERGERPVYDVGPQTTLDDAERVVLLVVHEKDGDIRADRKAKTLGRVRKIKV